MRKQEFWEPQQETDLSFAVNLCAPVAVPVFFSVSVQDQARRLRFESYLLDLRSETRTISAQDWIDSRFRQLAQDEAVRCWEESVAFSMIVLSGQKYGLRAPPLAIPKDVMDKLEAKGNLEAVKACYTLDTNRPKLPLSRSVYTAREHPSDLKLERDKKWDWGHGPEWVLKEKVQVKDLEAAAAALRGAAEQLWQNLMLDRQVSAASG